MKKIISVSLAFSMACFILISCQKSSIEKIEPVKKENFFSSAEHRIAFANYMKAKLLEDAPASRQNSNGAHFIVPFFGNDASGIMDMSEDGTRFTFVVFNGFDQSNYFYRMNPDSTVSAHYNTTNAYVDYYENLFDENAAYLWGEKGHYSADYTGPVKTGSLIIGGVVIFSWKYIDTSDPARAVSIQGNGKVGVNGAGPWKNLSLKVLKSPGGNVIEEFSIR